MFREFRTSPYPVIPASPGESETRRVPAPSHLAQRDVAKTHVSPSAWQSGLLAESRLAGHVCLADVSNQEETRQPQDCTRTGAFSQVFETARNLYKLSVSLSLQVQPEDRRFENFVPWGACSGASPGGSFWGWAHAEIITDALRAPVQMRMGMMM